jgi:hypothetical protein
VVTVTPEQGDKADRDPLVVADVQPLDLTGVRTVTVGVVAWTVAFLVLLPFYGTLRADGHLSWLWTCLAGIGLGVLGREYCKRREHRLRENPRGPETSPLGAAGL